MKKLIVVLLAVVALTFGLGGVAIAADNDTAVVTFEVTAINELNIDTGTVSLTVNAAVAGSAPTQATGSDTYDITTNVTSGSTKKITAGLSADMPTGLTLQIDVTAPTTGTGQGFKTLALTGGAVDVVTSIAAVAESNIAIDYTLDATVAAGVVASDTRTVTLTIVATT